MINLIPAWIETNEAFWNSLKRRNLFLIKLRFVAVFMLLAFNCFYEYLVNIELSEFQHNGIGIITLLLLIYNILFYYIRKRIKYQKSKFTPLHFSLLQIIADLFMLTLLIIITGGIESPLYLFYIFHLIIGSLILPGAIIYSIASAIIVIMFLISVLELDGILPHYCITGIYNAELYTNFGYVFTSLLFFNMMVVISVFLTNRIATQLYSQEKKLYNALREIKDAELKKQKYIMGIVHEIKSPIAASKSIISLITEGYVGNIPAKIKTKLERVIIRLDEGLKLINNILKISRLRLLNYKIVDLVDVPVLLQEIIEKNKERFDEKNTIIITKIKGNNKKIKGDGELLKMAFSNLIANAIKYTGINGLIKIVLNFNNDYLLITICDNGMGIPENEKEKIFENYYRINTGKQNAEEGTGIGLALVKEIIIQHRGKIEVNSPSNLGTEDNPGTCFKITLPFELEEIKKDNNKIFSVNGV